MLHIVKQFIFGLKLGLKSDLNNSDQFNSAVNNLDAAEKNTAIKATLELSKFFHDLDVNTDDTISIDEKSASNISDEQIHALLNKI